jgi:predicted phage baseplate assembly protein
MSARKGEKDTTGGLNNAHGSLALHLPLAMKPDLVQGKSAFWIRCRLETRREEQGMYTVSPRVTGIEAQVLGGEAWATHATIVRDELLGTSIGEPNQVFRLRHAPVLALREGEEVQVEEVRDGEVGFVPWTVVKDFSTADRFDRFYKLDVVSGDISFGPAVRQPDGSIRQYGRIPEAGRRIRISQYRYGGGVSGNVPADKIQSLHTAVAYIDRVTNFTRADGGRDQENIDELKMRAQRELRTQQRAVTAEDFENLGKMVSREVARVKCRGAGPGGRGQVPGVIELLVVPAAFDSIRAGDLNKLMLEPALQSEIRTYLDQYRLLATVLNIREPCYIGVKVKVEVAISEFSRPEAVKARVTERLNEFLSPLSLIKEDQPSELFGSHWEGWPFGRDLYISEIYSLIQQVPGVKHVLDVQASYRSVQLGKATEPSALAPVSQRVLQVPEDTLLCSLDHEVDVVEL